MQLLEQALCSNLIYDKTTTGPLLGDTKLPLSVQLQLQKISFWSWN